MSSFLARIPVVGGLAYGEQVQRVPSPFTATLQAEADHRYFRHPIAVLANGDKVGYIAPEIARSYYDLVRAAAVPVTCPGRRGSHIDREASGVTLLLDFTGLPTPA